MAKRIKKKTNARSSLKLESLEQRQLLAAITGDGVSQDNWQDLSNKGNTYDQVLMTGSSVTVQADAGQWVRTSFVDLSGDIVQVDFTGAGSLTISLSNFSGPAEAANYNQPGIEYVSGLASFTIQGSDATTQFSIYSVGKGVNGGVIAEGKEGGNHWADVQRLTIVANPGNPNGSTFGAIRMGNAIFGASEGAVGIAAANVHVQDTVVIGDIDAKGAATPQLVFGAASQFGSVRVAGGDLLNSNGNAIDNTTSSANQTSYVYDISFMAGAGSDVVTEGGVVTEGAITAAKVLNPAVDFKGAVGFITTLDSTTEIDLTGKTQAQINALFAGRTFQNDLVIKGDLKAGFEINAEAFRGDVTFEGDILGDIIFTDQNAGNPASSGFDGDVTFKGDVSGNIEAERFGNITIEGDFSGFIAAANVDDNGAPLPGGIDNITVNGDFSGSVESDWDIGNVWIGGDLTSGATAFTTFGSTALYQGNVGTVTVKGDVNQGSSLINVTGQGTVGDVVIEGAGDLDTMNIGQIFINDLGAGQEAVGSITITDVEGEADINFDGVEVDTGEGAIGAISITGSGAEDTALTVTGDIAGASVESITIGGFASVDLNNDIVATEGDIGAVSVTGIDQDGGAFSLNDSLSGESVGAITVAGFSTIAINADIVGTDGDVGAVSLTTLAGTDDDAASIVINGLITGDNVGAVTLDAGAEKSSVTINNSVGGGDSLGDVSILAEDVNLNTNIGADTVGAVTIDGTDVDFINASVTGETIGNVAITADTVTFDNGGISGDTIGDVTVTADTDTLNAGGIGAETAGDITFVGDTTLATGSGVQVETAGVILFDGKLTATANAGSNIVVDTADAIIVNGAASITAIAGNANIEVGTKLGGLHFNDTTTLSGGVLDSTSGVIDGSGTAGGTALLFTKLTADGGNLATGSVGNITFSGNANLGGGAFLVADNGEADLDTVGDITFTGTVASTDADLDIIASSVGDITVQQALSLTTKNAVNNLNVYAGQMTDETLAADGSDLGNYTIGNITVVDTQTKGFAGLSLFSGDSSFDAAGGVGNVTLTGGGTENQQTALFANAATDSLRITAGVFGTAANAASGTADAGFDFDAIGGIGFSPDLEDVDEDEDVDELIANADETNSNFSDGEVSIGDITINARAVDAGAGDVDAILGANGLLVAAGVDDLATTAGALDAELVGSIGDIMISNNSQVLTQTAATAITGTPGMFLATSVGTVQTLDLELESGDEVVIGDQGAAADDADDNGEFVVIVV